MILSFPDPWDIRNPVDRMKTCYPRPLDEGARYGGNGWYRTIILWIFSPALRPLKLHSHLVERGYLIAPLPVTAMIICAIVQVINLCGDSGEFRSRYLQRDRLALSQLSYRARLWQPRLELNQHCASQSRVPCH